MRTGVKVIVAYCRSYGRLNNVAEEDAISQMIEDIGNAILHYPRPTQRKQLIEQLYTTYKILDEYFKEKK